MHALNAFTPTRQVFARPAMSLGSKCRCDDNSSSRPASGPLPNISITTDRLTFIHTPRNPATLTTEKKHLPTQHCSPRRPYHTRNAAHRSPPRSAAPIKHPAAAEPKQPGARTRTILTVHAYWFRKHRRKSSHPELRGNLWHSRELPRDRGM